MGRFGTPKWHLKLDGKQKVIKKYEDRVNTEVYLKHCSSEKFKFERTFYLRFRIHP